MRYQENTMHSKTRWYIIRYNDQGVKVYYTGADSWSVSFYDRYFWYNRKPINHPVFNIYSGCEIIEESYTLSRTEESWLKR